MMDIYDSVAMGIVAVRELKDLINDERNHEKKEVLESVRFTYYYLIKNLTSQFGVTRFDVVSALARNGYDTRLAIEIANDYEDWAQHVIRVNEKGDNT